MSDAADRQRARVVWIAFIVAVFGWGVGFYGPATYLAVLHQTRGWSIATLSAAVTAHYLVSAVLIVALPDAYRRFGVGRVTLGGTGWAAMSGAAINAMVSP